MDSEIRYRRLFETAQDGILILDANSGLITDVNPFLTKLLSYSHDELLGKELWFIGLFKDIEASKRAIEELQTKGYVRYDDLPLKTREGKAVSVEFVSNVYDVGGRKVIQCNIRDITARKDATRLEQRVIQAQKMEAIGEVAGGMAHDFNNLLGVILGYCEILEKQEDLGESARKMIEEIHSAGSSARNLTQGLLAFSRRQVLVAVFLDLNEAVKRMGGMLARLIGESVQLKTVLGKELGTIKADPSQLEQVLMNLCINARDAMPGGGKLVIETSNADIDYSYCVQHPSARPGRYVLLSVRDTGTGMDAETQSRIFEPFFSTKEPGKGTGLGLSTVFGIVKQGDGIISVYSEPGAGTTFRIHFPRWDEAPAALPKKTASAIRGGTETILLVDDSSPLRHLTRLLLEQCGYTVIDSGDPSDALRMAEQHHGLLPLLITDVVMPGLSGPVLARKLGEARPEIRVLYTSGYAADQIATHQIEGQDYAFLEKPFTRDQLARKVRELLDSPAPVAA
jgi:PAS domain S-box-containing protein